MRLSKKRREATSEVDMTPMIDIVFLLIIFFMTVSQISAVNHERVDLPRLEGADDQKPVLLTVNVTEKGEIVIAGNRLALPQFISLVARQLVEVGDDPNRLTCVIRGDHRAKSKTMNEIANALKRMQIERVRFAVEVPQ